MRSRHDSRSLAVLAVLLAACQAPVAPSAPIGAPPTRPTPPDPPPGVVHESAITPPPITGAGLVIRGDLAIVSDADTDRLLVVSLSGQRVMHTVAFDAGSEPGRLAVDESNRVHVALRRTGELVSIDLVSGLIIARRHVCAAPRGVAWRQSDDTMIVACTDGLLGFLAADGSGEARTVSVDEDLRDVVLLADGRMLVSRFRSAEVLTLSAAGELLARRSPPAVLNRAFFGMRGDFESRIDGTSFEPDVAWRLVPYEGGAMMLHQRVTSSQLGTEPSGYGGGDPCGSIVSSAMTAVPADGDITQTSPVLGGVVLGVDFAVNPAGFLAVASPGRASPHEGFRGDITFSGVRQPDLFVFTSGVLDEAPFVPGSEGTPPDEEPLPEIGCAGSSEVANTPVEGGATTAVAWSEAWGWISVARSPTRVMLSPGHGVPVAIELGGRDAEHYGHELFHAATGAGIACASCHAEGGDDGRTWDFDPIGPRRTQTMRGGLMGTEPFHWDGDMRDFGTLLEHVFAGRMSGPELSTTERDAFGRWMDALPALPRPAQEASAVLRGRDLFMSPEVACSSCHSGEQLTNGATIDVGTGGAFQVPTLTGIAHRAPYMHDGCASTLEARLTDADCGGGDMHGRTSALTPEQVGDLAAYLRTL